MNLFQRRDPFDVPKSIEDKVKMLKDGIHAASEMLECIEDELWKKGLV